MLFIYMNNNLIEFKNKYLKYKYKYITLKNQSFSTYNTKFKQIGGAYDFVCVIDEEGPFNSVEECYKTRPPAADLQASSFDAPPAAPLRSEAAPSPGRSALLSAIVNTKPKATPISSEGLSADPRVAAEPADPRVAAEPADPRVAAEPADLRDRLKEALHKQWLKTHAMAKDDDWEDNKYLKYKHKYLKYKHKYITLKDQLFFKYDTKIK
jgi:hypothetical protein